MSPEELEWLAVFTGLGVAGFFCCLFLIGIHMYFFGGIKKKPQNLKQLIIEAIVEASLEIEKRNRANQQRAKRDGNGLELDECFDDEMINAVLSEEDEDPLN